MIDKVTPLQNLLLACQPGPNLPQPMNNGELLVHWIAPPHKRAKEVFLLAVAQTREGGDAAISTLDRASFARWRGPRFRLWVICSPALLAPPPTSV